MTLRRTVAGPFKWSGDETLEESEFVVALSLDRGWFSPDQAKRLIAIAEQQGLLDRSESGLSPTFDPATVELPEGFTPDESVLSEPQPFERLLEAIEGADVGRRTAVAQINRLQTGYGISIEAAAVLVAHRNGVAVDPVLPTIRTELQTAVTD